MGCVCNNAFLRRLASRRRSLIQTHRPQVFFRPFPWSLHETGSERQGHTMSVTHHVRQMKTDRRGLNSHSLGGNGSAYCLIISARTEQIERLQTGSQLYRHKLRWSIISTPFHRLDVLHETPGGTNMPYSLNEQSHVRRKLDR